MIVKPSTTLQLENATVLTLMRLHLQGQLTERESATALIRASKFYGIGGRQIDFINHMFTLSEILTQGAKAQEASQATSPR